MRRLKWLLVCTLLLFSCSPLFGEEQSGRHFNFNPGNMMDGMVNPMRNMFSGYGRDQGPYSDYYPYGAPQGYPYYPQNYRYPSGYYPQPPVGYGTPATQYPTYPVYQQPVQPAPQAPNYTEQQAKPNYQPTPAAKPTSPYPSPPREQFIFRPMEQQPSLPDSGQQTGTPYQQTPNLPTRPDYRYNPTPVEDSGYQQAYPQSTQVPVDQRMKFRPLDQPGYSQ
jgi:hypothetical protein